MRAACVVLAVALACISAPTSALGIGWVQEEAPNPEGATASNLEGISCLTSPSTSCKAVGKYSPWGALALSWSGTSWTVQNTPEISGDELFGTSCVTSSFCVGVGSKNTAENTLAEHWNGASWTAVTTPNPSGVSRHLYGVSCTSSTACTAVGSVGGTTIQRENLAIRWNGTSWSAQTTPNPGKYQNELYAVSCTSSTHCTAVGRQRETNAANWTVAMIWNGSTWATQSTPNPEGAASAELKGVSCTSSSNCIAIGYSQISGVAVPLAMQWNGTKWSLQSVPLPEKALEGFLYGVSCPTSSECIAVGSYTPEGPPFPSLTYAAQMVKLGRLRRRQIPAVARTD
jgi:hypothetical protein